jgi:hypothetical protein
MKPTDPPPPKASAGHRPPPDGDRGPLPHGAPPEPGPHRRDDVYDDGVPRHAPGLHDEFDNVDTAHEHSDVNIRAVMTAAGIIAAVVAGAMVGMYLLFGVFEWQAARAHPYVSPLAPPPTEMPPTTMDSPFFSEAAGGVPLLTDEPRALEHYRAEERRRLESYGWVNEGAGVAHIPIEEAKRLLIERGLPSREFYPVEPTLGTRLPSMGGSSSGRVITGILPAADDADAAADDTDAAADAPQDEPEGADAPAPQGSQH